MSPSFCNNDYVVIVPSLFIPYRVGDVVVLKHLEFGVIIKRITQTAPKRFFLEGDNSKSSYVGWVPASAIIGRVRMHFSAQSAQKP